MISRVGRRLVTGFVTREGGCDIAAFRSHKNHYRIAVDSSLKEHHAGSLNIRRTFSSSTNHAETKHEIHGFNLSDQDCNVTSNIASRVGANLHNKPKHPLNTIKGIIEDYWRQQSPDFCAFDDFSPIVSAFDNFDSLLIPKDHVSRSLSDTYYLDIDTVLRTHTSAHQTTLLKQGYNQFLVTGDVYRRDEIDCSHYPVFHQME